MRSIILVKQKNKLKIISFGIIILFSLIGCSNHSEYKNIEQSIQELRKNIITQRKKIPPYQQHFPQGVTYKSQKLRDPFKQAAEVTDKKSTNLDASISYPINMLKFIGTLSKNNTVFAYILGPDNKIYQVKEGDPLGDHNGKILHIYPNRLEIGEQDSDNPNRNAQRIVTLQLKEGEENAKTP